MSQETNKPEGQLAEFLEESRKIFRQKFQDTGLPSVLIAKHTLESYVEQGVTNAGDALKLIHNTAEFEGFLQDAEGEFQEKLYEKLHTRMNNLERNTNWRLAAGISLGTGTVTGLIFALASPFITTVMQPTADKWFKDSNSTQDRVISQTPEKGNITNNNITNNFWSPTTNISQTERQSDTEKDKLQEKLTCKVTSLGESQGSLRNFLKQGNIVTLEMHGKKVSVCYRPQPKANQRPQGLTK